MKNLSFAPYVRGTVGDSWLHQEAFTNELGSTSVDGTSLYSYSGEIGFVFRMTQGLNLRIGAEAFAPAPVSDAKGKDSTGAQLLTVNSSIFVFNPQVALEVVAVTFKSGSRVMITGGAGYAFVNLKNDYNVTTAGQTALGLPSYTETATATQINGFASTAYEFCMVDHVLGMLELGYRYLPVTGLEHSQAQKTFAEKTGNGAANGAPLLNSNGLQRQIDLSGFFVGLSFRFYIQ